MIEWYVLLYSYSSFNNHCKYHWYVDLAAPPEMQQPLFNRLNGDSTVTMRIFPASEKHGPIMEYYIMVVTEKLAKRKQPDDFNLADVCCGYYVFCVNAACKNCDLFRSALH